MIIRLSIIGDDGKPKEEHDIKDIPNDVLSSYIKAAKRLLPERGDSAWAAYLANCMLNIIKHTHRAFVLTDIPISNYDAVIDLLNGMKISFSGLMNRMFASAGTNRLHIVNYVLVDEETREPSKVRVDNMRYVILTGMDDSWWSKYEEAASKIPSVLDPKSKMTPIELIAILLEQGVIDVKSKPTIS